MHVRHMQKRAAKKNGDYRLATKINIKGGVASKLLNARSKLFAKLHQLWRNLLSGFALKPSFFKKKSQAVCAVSR